MPNETHLMKEAHPYWQHLEGWCVRETCRYCIKEGQPDRQAGAASNAVSG